MKIVARYFTADGCEVIFLARKKRKKHHKKVG